MKRAMLGLALVGTLLTSGAFAAQPNTYQVTGPITAITNDTITVQKGKEQWQIARTADTKVSGDLKVGNKVTIEYRMTATTITVKSSTKKTSK